MTTLAPAMLDDFSQAIAPAIGLAASRIAPPVPDSPRRKKACQAESP